MPPTLALTFLLREKSAKAYPRGYFLLEISSKMEQRDILKGNDEKFCFSRDCNVTQFLKTFGEWSIATFSRATAQNFVLAETVTLPSFHETFGEWSNATFSRATSEKLCFSRDCNVTQFPKTFGEWSNATFSRAMRRNFIYSQTKTLPIMAARS